MTLKQWRIKQKHKQYEVAYLLDTTPAYYSRIENGKDPVGVNMARRIVELTKGKVTFSDLREIAFVKTKRQVD